jgi:hypothetical protein
MAYKNLASFPQKYMDAWMEFISDPSFKIYVPTQSEANGIKLRLYQFRRHFQAEASGMGKVFDDIELTVGQNTDGWFVGISKGGWLEQVNANKRRRETDDTA